LNNKETGRNEETLNHTAPVSTNFPEIFEKNSLLIVFLSSPSSDVVVKTDLHQNAVAYDLDHFPLKDYFIQCMRFSRILDSSISLLYLRSPIF